MRIARRSLAVAGVSLGIAWSYCGAMFVLFFWRGHMQDAPDWLVLGYVCVFAFGHLVAFCASIAAAVYGVSALIRSPEIRRPGTYCFTAAAMFLSIVLSFVVLSVPKLS